MSRLAVLAVAVVLLADCGSKSAPARLLTGCDGPDGSCARYLPALDEDGAPTGHAHLIVPFTAPIRVVPPPRPLAAATAFFNLDTRADDLRLVPVRALRGDPQNARQVIVDLDGLLADGAAIDLPDGVVQDARGHGLGPLTVKVATGLDPFAVTLAGTVWDPRDRSLFGYEGLQPPHHATDEAGVRRELEDRLRIRPAMTDAQVAAVLGRYDSDAVKLKAPNPRVRAGLLLLTDTSAAYAIDFILADTNRRGVPFEPLQVRDIAALGAAAAVFWQPLIGRLQMVIDTATAADSLEVVAAVVAHEAVHSSLGGGSATEETLAMTISSRVYEEFLLFDPSIARAPTPLTRQINGMVLALRNSGRYGYPHAGILPRPGVDDTLRGTGDEPARSFKDMLFKPDVYGDLPKAGDTTTEVLESYYRRISGTADQGQLKFDQSALKLFDQALDHDFTGAQILAIADALDLAAAGAAATP